MLARVASVVEQMTQTINMLGLTNQQGLVVGMLGVGLIGMALLRSNKV